MYEPQHIKDLRLLGLASDSDRIFHSGTRDDPSILVKQGSCGIFYLDRCAVKRDPYVNRPDPFKAATSRDVLRRMSWIRKNMHNAPVELVCDIGSGAGGLLLRLKHEGYTVFAVEPDPNFKDNVNGVLFLDKIADLPDSSFDLITCMHVLEHFDNPIQELTEIYKKLKPNGYFVFEVPHAGDILIQNSHLFRKHTFWSEHKILHTKHSLQAFLMKAGFPIIFYDYVQRYSKDNHIGWSALPQECKTYTDDEYANWLKGREQTDTIIGIAQK